jgi:hypothetical protein
MVESWVRGLSAALLTESKNWEFLTLRGNKQAGEVDGLAQATSLPSTLQPAAAAAREGSVLAKSLRRWWPNWRITGSQLMVYSVYLLLTTPTF